MSKFNSKEEAITYLNLITHDTMSKMGLEYFKGFKIGGHYFLGDYPQACEMFAKNNPNGEDFFVWCQKTLKTI